MSKSTKIALTKSQVEFVLSTAKFPLFCAGYGAGKSHMMGFCAVKDAMHSSNALIGVYEPDYSLIRTIAIPRVRQWLDEFGISYTLNKQDQAIYCSSSGVGDFQFKSLDNPDALVGYETYRSHIDELDTLPADKAEAVFFKIMGRNRQSPHGVPEEYKKWVESAQRFECINRIYAYTTPEGFKFCHKMWSPSGENAIKNKDFAIFKGRTEDNPTLTEDYIQSLKSTYPSGLLKAYMEGEFVNLESGTVYYTFNRIKHDTAETVRDADILHIGVDFNVNQTCGIVFVDRQGIVCAVDEFVKKYDTKALIDSIKAKYPKNRIICYPDASGGRRTTSNTAQSDIIQLKNAGFEVRAFSKNPAVKDRVTSVLKMFQDNKCLVNAAACPEAVRCLEQQAYDSNGDPDKKSGFDHSNDAFGYQIFYRFGLRKPVFKIPFSFAQKR